MKKQKLEQEIVKAMKAKNKERLGALKVFKAEVQNEEISNKIESATNLMVETIASKLVKQMNKALEEVENEKNRELLNVCSEFLPKQLNKEEVLEKLVREGINLQNAKNRGQMFGMVKKSVGNSASVEVINEVVEIYSKWV